MLCPLLLCLFCLFCLLCHSHGLLRPGTTQPQRALWVGRTAIPKSVLASPPTRVCNCSSLRDHHWHVVSELVGYPKGYRLYFKTKTTSIHPNSPQTIAHHNHYSFSSTEHSPWFFSFFPSLPPLTVCSSFT